MLRCEECGNEATSDVEARGWRAFLTIADEHEPEGIVVLCPECAEREFGAARGGSSGNPGRKP
jgi:hypothetical protein